MPKKDIKKESAEETTVRKGEEYIAPPKKAGQFT